MIARRSLSAVVVLSSLAFLNQAHGEPAKTGSTPTPPPASTKTSHAAAPKNDPAGDSSQHKVTKNVSVVRVNVTDQPYDFIHPWSKKAPQPTYHALGAVLPGNRVLVTAELVANCNYAEFENAETREKTPAIVETVDYEANLAILKPVDENFLKGIKPLEMKDAKVGDTVAVWQLENTGTLLSTSALVTTVEVSHYPLGDSAMLIYRLTSSLQYRDSSFTVPVVKDGKLVGFLMRYDARTQNVDVIPTPVIQHFLNAAAKKEYHGFPEAGMLYASTRNPELRSYAGLKPDQAGGVYVTQVLKHGPTDNAGLQVGDVILSINGKPIDQDGDYDDPQYGKLALIDLISTKSYDGDVLKFKIARNGKPESFDVKVTNRPPDDYVIEPYIIDKAPKYYVLGGLVLQELSRQYLKEWGPEWYKKAPQRFVYMDQLQSELFPERHQKVVFLSQVLPSSSTLGYEDLGGLIVTKINDVPINSLADVRDRAEKPDQWFSQNRVQRKPEAHLPRCQGCRGRGRCAQEKLRPARPQTP